VEKEKIGGGEVPQEKAEERRKVASTFTDGSPLKKERCLKRPEIGEPSSWKKTQLNQRRGKDPTGNNHA